MFLVVRADGKYWDGMNWAEQGKTFFSPASATRSLYEEGEDCDRVEFIEVEHDPA